MKRKKLVNKKIEEHWEIAEIICDICKNIIQPDGVWDLSEVTIESKIGDIFPEGDCRNWTKIDCCPFCFINKVVPLIEKEFNIKFREPDVEDYQELREAEAFTPTKHKE